jgi:glycine betaine catabolism B
MQLELVEKIKHKGTDVMSFKFCRSDEQSYLNYKAGQFTIMDLGTKEDPEGPSRYFTIASSPTEKDIVLISTRIRGTPFKQKLANLEIGTKVSLKTPAGKFVLHKDYSKTAVMLSGGIGVTPFRSMIKYSTDMKLPLKIVMFDSNRDEDNMLYKNDFDGCLDANKNLNILYTVTDESNTLSDSKIEHGKIDKKKIMGLISEEELAESIFYICGPPGMLKAMQELLKEEMAIPKKQIKVEEFTGY